MTSAVTADIPSAAAIAYAARGWRVFPLAPRSKAPLTEHGYHDATDDPETIRHWWGARSKSGVGIACAESGLVVIDIDPAHGGREALADLVSKLGTLPATVEAATGGGGAHYLFNLPASLSRARGHLARGVDIKLHGYIAAAPSVHPSGTRYSWVHAPGDVPLADLPEAWIEAIRAPATERHEPSKRTPTGESTHYGLAALEGECSAVKSSPDGARNNRLNQAAFSAGQLESGGELDPSDVMPALLDAARVCGLSDSEAKRTIASGLRAGRSSPRRAPERSRRQPAIVDENDQPPHWEPPESAVDPSDGVSAEWAESLAFKTRSDGARVLGATPGNLALLLTHSEGWAGTLCYDSLEHCSSWALTPPELEGLTPPRGRLEEQHCTYVRHWMALHHGVSWSHDAAWTACQLAAAERSRHPVQAYLETLAWDGELRIDHWLQTYLGSPEEGRHVGAWWLISAVARAMRPGCQVDHALILEGPQGARKSTALRILAGEWYQGALGDLRDKDGVQSLLGAWIVEISELEAIRGQAVSRVKEFLTQTHDRYRPSYGRGQVVRPRSCVFAGTTNDAAYLYDSTGARRFWPVSVQALDLDALERDRDQLWAEAVIQYRDGVQWWPRQSDEPELAEIADSRTVHDPWEPIVAARIADRADWSAREILSEVLKLDTQHLDRTAAMRVGAICRRLGCSKVRSQRDGAREWRWAKI